MITSKDCLQKYGDPNLQRNMVVWDVPTELEVGVIPKKLYCNKDLIPALTKAFQNLKDSGAYNFLKTFDGCFNIRKMRGLTSMSIHSWGLALDFNAFENQLNQVPKMHPLIVKCFKDAGFDWGGDWKRLDGMHFQLSKLP